MSDLRIRNISDDLKFMLRSDARAKSSTMEKVAVEMLQAEFQRRRSKRKAERRRLRQELFEKYGPFEDSATGIREDRDARG